MSRIFQESRAGGPRVSRTARPQEGGEVHMGSACVSEPSCRRGSGTGVPRPWGSENGQDSRVQLIGSQSTISCDVPSPVQLLQFFQERLSRLFHFLIAFKDVFLIFQTRTRQVSRAGLLLLSHSCVFQRGCLLTESRQVRTLSLPARFLHTESHIWIGLRLNRLAGIHPQGPVSFRSPRMVRHSGWRVSSLSVMLLIVALSAVVDPCSHQ